MSIVIHNRIFKGCNLNSFIYNYKLYYIGNIGMYVRKKILMDFRMIFNAQRKKHTQTRGILM